MQLDACETCHLEVGTGTLTKNEIAYARISSFVIALINNTDNEELQRICKNNGLLTSLKELGL